MAFDRPLAGIRVLDLSRLLPGPWCSLLLADLGAEVIKVETPLAGDYARIAPPELGFGGVFEAVNRGKRSIAVNYRLPRGRDVLLRLAADADVFLEASMPGQVARRGLGPADVVAANPRIVYCSLSGYGQAGPYRDRPGHDLDYLAIGGLLSLLGPAGARPVPPGLQVADLAGGTLAALEIIAALFRRERTGLGAVLDVAVLDAIVGWLGPLGTGVTHGRHVGRSAVRPLPLLRGVPGGRRHLPRPGCPGAAVLGRLLPGDRPGGPRPAPVRSSRDRRRRGDPGHSAPDGVARAPRRRGMCRAGQRPRGGGAGSAGAGARAGASGEGEAAHLVSPLRARRPATATAQPGAPGLGDDTLAVLAAAGFPGEEIECLEAAGIVARSATPEATARAARLGTALARMATRERPVPDGAPARRVSSPR